MSFFKFKGFELMNESSAFKINTDGVLLGAWMDLSKCLNALEIGSGTGVVSIMAKHRFPDCRILGIDIDRASVLESQFNLDHNKLMDLSFEHMSLSELVMKDGVKGFEHIFTNPPYFVDSSSPKGKRLAMAKHSISLRLDDIVDAVCRMESPDAGLTIILPIRESLYVEEQLSRRGFGLVRELKIQGRKESAPIRRLMYVKRNADHALVSDTIHLYEDDQRTKSEAYSELVSQYYL